MKDLYKKAGFKYTGIGGIKCQCCDNKLGNKRKSKVARNTYNKLRRNCLKQKLYKEAVDGEIEAIEDNILITKL